ncbi:MAG: T9SS type A sorting domain-containing protein [candidate division Zixibacteria bacterium]|nr:T9SS type A sorting domain-containing protein [Candidatus Tariuqbacter arcticus]
MKKHTIILFIIIFGFTVPLSAQVQIWMPDTTASPGDTIMIPVYTGNVDTSQAVLSYQMEIHFDEAVGNIINYDTCGTLTPSNWIATYNFNIPGVVIGGGWYFFPPYLSGEGVLVYLQCVIPEGASDSTDLNFTYFMYNEDPMPTTDGSITITTSSSHNLKGDEFPQSFRLLPAYPNPFNHNSVLGFELRVASSVELAVYDVIGRKIQSLVSGQRLAGEYEVVFDGSGLGSGVYFARLKAGELQKSTKLLLIK